jgi:hypothetical protein
MLEKVDSGKRKLSLWCDQRGVMAKQAHTKTFNPPNAYDDAMTFAKANGFEDKAVIEKIMEMPFVPPVLPSMPGPEVPMDLQLTDEERAIQIISEMVDLGDNLLPLLDELKGRSTKQLRANMTKLTRVMRDLQQAMRAAL